MRLYLPKEEGFSCTPVEACFPFLSEHGHVVSLVGGGGKTTLMNALAGAYSRNGMKTVMMTTTRILNPGNAAKTIEECQSCWAAGKAAVCGEETPEGKLRAPKDDMITALLGEADAVLIEADGAKRMACKAPAAHEPVILPKSDIVIGVIGAEVLGQPVESVCFRPQYVCDVLDCGGGHRLTADDLAKLLLSENGTRKGVGERIYYTVINKCDDEERLQAALEIARALKRRGQERIVLAQLKCME